jgi:hypothetical protein
MMSACPTIAEVRDFARAIRAEGSATDSPAEPSRSKKMRDAGFTRRPSWRSLPKDADDEASAEEVRQAFGNLSDAALAGLAGAEPAQIERIEQFILAEIYPMHAAQPVAAPEPLHGFSREDLEAVAEGLESQPQTVNVGNATGEGDDHLPSTAAVAAKFIRAILATQPGTEK